MDIFCKLAQIILKNVSNYFTRRFIHRGRGGVMRFYAPVLAWANNSVFRRFSGHNLRWALFVYRLIGATLIGIFFDDPFLK